MKNNQVLEVALLSVVNLTRHLALTLWEFFLRHNSTENLINRKIVVFIINSKSGARKIFHEARPSEISRRTSAIYPNTSLLCYHMLIQ